jgi:transcriptional regulator with XRE-family HTH domain
VTSADVAPDPVRLAVGQAIRRARQESGLSMRALALACGLSQPFLSAVERGGSTPSIATLYRLAEVLGTTPASLLPAPADGAVNVVRAGQGRLVPSSDQPGSAIGRVVFSDPARHLEVYEYVVAPTDDLEVWFEHPGDTVLHLIDGTLRIEFDSVPDVVLEAGDCVVHPGPIPHRWSVVGDCPVRLFLVVVRPETATTQ